MQVDDGKSMESEESYVNPWSSSTMKELSRKMMKKIMGYRVSYINFKVLYLWISRSLSYSLCYRDAIQVPRLVLEK